MKDINKKAINYIFLCLLVLMVGYAIFMCAKKEGYYVDEPWSYGLANCYYQPFLQDFDGYMEQWHDGQFFMDYVEVNPEHRFQYDSVFYNQTNDVHPPMYYSLLHTVSSFFPGTFSKWYGLSINLVLFVIELVLLLKLSRLFLDENKLTSLAPVIIYGINAGTLSMVVYLRMYSLAVMWTTLFIYLTCRMVMQVMGDGYEEKKLNFRLWLPFVIVSICGSLSHYFFILMCGTVGFFVFVYLIIKKRKKQALLYMLSSFLGGGIAIGIFPGMWAHLMDTNVSDECIYNILHFNMAWMIQRIKDFYAYIAKEWTGGTVLLNVLVLASVVLLVVHATNKERREKSFLLYMFIATEVSYFLMIDLIAIDLTERYHFFIYPFVGLILVKLIYDVIPKDKANMDLIMSISISLFAVLLAFLGKVNYIYPGYAAALEEMGTTYRDVPAFYVCKGDHVIINDCLFAGQQDAVYPIYYDKLDMLPQVLDSSEYDTSKGLVVYAEIYWDREETVNRIAEMTGLTVDHMIYDNTYTWIYYLK